jgi:hypothetical protein
MQQFAADLELTVLPVRLPRILVIVDTRRVAPVTILEPDELVVGSRVQTLPFRLLGFFVRYRRS